MLLGTTGGGILDVAEVFRYLIFVYQQYLSSSIWPSTYADVVFT